jgi:DNA-binding PadR family transcriptional regulator
MKMVVLGILMEGNSHPYEMQQFIKRREMEKYIRLQKGSLYYTVDQLVKSGSIEVDSVIRDTSHPDKTVYRITEAGRREFRDLLLEQLEKPDDYYNSLHEAIAFIKHLDKTELVDALKLRIKNAENTLSYLKSSYKHYETHIPKYGLYIMASAIEFCKIEIRTLQRVLEDTENGSLYKFEAIKDPYTDCN